MKQTPIDAAIAANAAHYRRLQPDVTALRADIARLRQQKARVKKSQRAGLELMLRAMEATLVAMNSPKAKGKRKRRGKQ